VAAPVPGIHTANPSCHRFGVAIWHFLDNLAHPCSHSVSPSHSFSVAFVTLTHGVTIGSRCSFRPSCLLETVFPSLDLTLLVVGFSPWMYRDAHGFSATTASPSPPFRGHQRAFLLAIGSRILVVLISWSNIMFRPNLVVQVTQSQT